MKATGKAEWIDVTSTEERRILDLRSIGMRHALALGCLHYTRASQPLAEQCHGHWLVLVMLLSGEQRYWIDGREVAVRGGEMLRILPGQRYGTGGRPEQKGDLAWLILEARPRGGGAALGMTAEGAAAVFSLLADPGKPRTFPLPDATATAVRDAFAWWPLRKEALGREMIRSRVSAIVLGAAAALDKGPADASANRVTGSRIRVVLKWLEEHPETMPTNRELADLAGLSSASFHSHFKRITGCSPKDYHLRRLVERAAVRLTGDPGLSVTRLAHDLGFSSSQYFATVFRRYHGLAPSDYRRASRERGLSR